MKNLFLSACCICLTVCTYGQNLRVAGNVGIGLNSPAYKLDILSNDLIGINLTGNSPAGALARFSDGNDEVSIGIGNSNDLILRNGNQTVARATSSGTFLIPAGRRLGINIDNPASYFQINNTGNNTSTDYSMWITSSSGIFRTNRWAHLQFSGAGQGRIPPLF